MTLVAVAHRVEVPRCWSGETVVCLASGPSLTQADVDRCRGKHVIAVNDAVRLAAFADVLYSSAGEWWHRHLGMPEFRGMKFAVEPKRMAGRIRIRTEYTRWPDIQVLRHSGHTGLSLEPDALRTGHNSGYAAVNLAVLFGARTVILLGYDMGFSKGQKHFFKESGQVQPSPYETFIRAFATMVEPLKQAGVEVVNCSRISKLECFPKADLSDVI